jgi:hypothetical protein
MDLYSLMKPLSPEAEGFQLGCGQLRKRGTIALYGEKRQVFYIFEGGAQFSISRHLSSGRETNVLCRVTKLCGL